MRYVAIIALLFIGCSTSSTTGTVSPDSFNIIVQFHEQQTENIVLQVLNRNGVLQGFNIRHPNNYVSEIDATCTKLRDTNMDALWVELKQTAGVSHVVFNPR